LPVLVSGGLVMISRSNPFDSMALESHSLGGNYE
jgi:hypothetical protein